MLSKKIIKPIISSVVIFSVILCLNSSASAESITISNVQTARIATVPNIVFTDNNEKRSNIGGIAVGKTKNSLFVVKSDVKEASAAFYYYPDISTPSKYAVFRLRYAGHANAMTIDNKNIYVAGWYKNDEIPKTNTYNNWIIMIPRTVIANMTFNKDGKTIPRDDASTSAVEGFSILRPKVKVINSDGSVSYKNYEKVITAISKHKTNGSFIIRCSLPGAGRDLAFTTAKLETINEETQFIVSENNSDMFIVKDNTAYINNIKQDICYSPGNGFFIPLWYGGTVNSDDVSPEEYNNYLKYNNRSKNVILWADIDKTTESKVINGVSYRYYIPNKINVDKSKEKEYGKVKYDSFEFESIAFTQKNELLFSCNVVNNSQYISAYKANHNNSSPPADGVFKLTYDNGKNFVL